MRWATNTAEHDHSVLSQFDEYGNRIGGNTWTGNYTMGGHNHSHTFSPSSGWIQYSNMSNDYYDNTVVFQSPSIVVDGRDLTEAVEDLAVTLKLLVDKYDLKEIKPMLKNKNIQEWVDAGMKRILGKYQGSKEKEDKEEEHIDDKLFEI